MKESENYQQTYIAFPIKESPLLDFLKKLNPRKKFHHFTLYFLNNLNDKNIDAVKEVSIANKELLKKIYFKPQGLDMIGIHERTFVLKIELTPELLALRKSFEERIPSHLDTKLPFLPHISIKKKYDRGFISRIKDTSNSIEPFYPSSIGIFYRTTENATALLFNHKI